MTAQALPKNQELAEKINSFVFTRRKVSKDDLNFRRLKKELKDLDGKISNADYYDFLGQIACLENDRTNIIEYYKKAIKLAHDDYNIRHNYAAFLTNSGLLPQAVEQAKFLVNNFPNETESLTHLIRNTLGLCRFEEASQLLKKLEKPTEFYDITKEAVSIFENAGLSDDEAQYLCELAYSVLETQNLYHSGFEIEITEDCVLYTIYVDLPVEKLFDVNWKLANIFAEKAENMRSSVLMFEYSSVDILEEKEKHERIV